MGVHRRFALDGGGDPAGALADRLREFIHNTTAGGLAFEGDDVHAADERTFDLEDIMRVLASTARPEGQRGDISTTSNVELVRFPTRTGKCPDNCPNCSCLNAMVRFGGSTTTTFTVLEVNLDVNTYAELLLDALARDPWVDIGLVTASWVREWADEHLAAACRYPVGAVLELRNGTVCERVTVV